MIGPRNRKFPPPGKLSASPKQGEATFQSGRSWWSEDAYHRDSRWPRRRWCGLEPGLAERLVRSGHVDAQVRTFEATSIIGESTRAAYLDAVAWLVKGHGG